MPLRASTAGRPMGRRGVTKTKAGKAKRVTERRKRTLERDAEKIVAEKLQRVNEPGVAVKSLPFNVVDVEMDDIEDDI